MKLVVEALDRHHVRGNFFCGNAELDDWFRHRARQDETRNVARIFVAVEDKIGVAGFYSLSSFTLLVGDLPPDIARKLPRYEMIPAAMIGRLARDERVKGQGVGGLLLADAIRRILGAARSVAAFAIVAEAKDDRAAKYYSSFGFRPFPLRPSRLFLPTASAARAMLDP